jgi:hypothetical protein
MKTMQRILVTGLLAAGALGATSVAQARGVAWSVGLNVPGVSIGVGNPYGYGYGGYGYGGYGYCPPAAYAPPVYVQPQPVYYAPPAYYVSPRVMYGPAYYGGYYGRAGYRYPYGGRYYR